ncbi:MAG: sugar phosphate nucleotidyltransferase, partial [Candidatus Paceibacteria bacterium]
MKALIAAGGKGSRLYPLTHTQNKHTIPLANTPLITLAVEKVVEAGITDIGISINEGDQEIYRIIGDGSRWGVNITYIEQTGGALGVAHVIGNAASFLNGDDFLFYLGDNIITNDLSLFVDKFYQEELNCLLALTQVYNPTQFGVPVIDNNRIVRIDEKPAHPPSQYAVAGLYMYDSHMLDAVQQLTLSERGEYEI